MKRLEIDLNELLNIKDTNARKKLIESKLKDAGFDKSKFTLSAVDTDSMKYVYMQDDN